MAQSAKVETPGHFQEVGFCGESDGEVDATRAAALSRVQVSDIQRLDSKQILLIQSVLKNGERFGFWATPQHWLVASFKRRAVNGASIDLRQRIVDHLPEDLRHEISKELVPIQLCSTLDRVLDLAVLVMTRYLILLRMGPVGMKRSKYQSLDVSTILRLASAQLPPLFAAGVCRMLKSNKVGADVNLHLKAGGQHGADSFLRFLEGEDIEGLSGGAQRAARNEARRMQMMHEMDIWNDVPRLDQPSKAMLMTSERKFAEKRAPAENPHLPLPDDYVAQMGSRSLWLLHDLYPTLMSIGARLAQLWDETESSGGSPLAIRQHRYLGVKEIIESHRWIDRNGNAIVSIPFPLQLPKEVHSQKVARVRAAGPERELLAWPPRGTRDIVALLGVVQMAHYFILALSMGARQSETLDLTRDALRVDAQGRSVLRGHDGALVRGRTFKLEANVMGRARDWLLPGVAVLAYKQQVKLVELLERLSRMKPREAFGNEGNRSARHLWAQAAAGTRSNTAKPLGDINSALHTFARSIGMAIAPGGQNLRSHRLRKTLARLVALALTQAPAILMDVFGHKDIEMTLYYILSDKELRSEIEVVERELRVMRAKEVVESMVEADVSGTSESGYDFAGYGGLAALKIHAAVQMSRRDSLRRGEEFGANDIVELSELLTFQGHAWEQVRHGVVCTKVPGQTGPCNKGLGRPEPSRCQTSCDHRLEEAFLRADVDGAIQEAIAAYEAEQSKGEELRSAFWAGQIRAHIPRFDDLRDKWMCHPTVNALVNGAPQK